MLKTEHEYPCREEIVANIDIWIEEDSPGIIAYESAELRCVTGNAEFEARNTDDEKGRHI